MDKWMLLSLIFVVIVIANIAIFSLRDKKIDEKKIGRNTTSIEGMARMVKRMKKADRVEFWLEDAEKFSILDEKVKELGREIAEEGILKDVE